MFSCSLFPSLLCRHVAATAGPRFWSHCRSDDWYLFDLVSDKMYSRMCEVNGRCGVLVQQISLLKTPAQIKCAQPILRFPPVTINALNWVVSDRKERQLNITYVLPEDYRVITGASIVGGPPKDPPLRNMPKWKSVTIHAEQW
jgi:hypothetical protein